MTITSEDRTKIRMWEEFLKRGSRGDKRDINETYQRVFRDDPNRRFKSFTLCDGCCLDMVRAMIHALDIIDGIIQVPQGTQRIVPHRRYRLRADGTLEPVDNRSDGSKETSGKEADAVTA